MKFFFYGDTKSNVGPQNVNRLLLEHLSHHFLWPKSKNKYLYLIEAVSKLLVCRVVVISGISRKGYVLLRMAKFLNRKTVYIMHGCSQFERKLNGVSRNQKGIDMETGILEHADLLLPVSEKFMNWVKTQYPQYAHKTYFLYNGINTSVPKKYRTEKRKPGSIAVSGGSTLLKNNLTVVHVVNSMDKSVYLEIFGDASNGYFSDNERIFLVGEVAHEEFLRRLSRVQLFVLNSVFESFSLATVEALLCGCSVLISECAGITGLLELEECDLIHDPMDQDEIRRKIEYLLENPNNERILAKLNLEEYTYPKTVERLERICGELTNRKK